MRRIRKKLTNKILREGHSKTNMIVGEFTYGHENITFNWCKDSKIEIGKYCSIAANVMVQCGGNHRSEWITTFPFGHDSESATQIQPIVGHPKPPRGIVIGNDVWIGNNVTIMGGTRIGDGAIVGMNSHVFGDIPAYSIYSGNPAKLLKFRFEQNIIDALIELKWWSYQHERILEIVPKLCQAPTEKLISEINQILSN